MKNDKNENNSNKNSNHLWREVLCALCRKEDDPAYNNSIVPYFHRHRVHPNNVHDKPVQWSVTSMDVTSPRSCLDGTRDDACGCDFAVDITSRRKMIQWCYQVATVCSFDPETISIAVSHFDRFLSSRCWGSQAALRNANLFQLSLFTCLYMAVKVHEHEVMEPNMIASISHGVFSAQHVITTEQTIVEALQWKLTPPTATAFVHYLWNLIQPLFSSSDAHDGQQHPILTSANLQTQLVMIEYEFITIQPSIIAMSCLMNAIEQTIDSAFEFMKWSNQITTMIMDVTDGRLNCQSTLVRQTQERIRIHQTLTTSPTSTIVTPTNTIKLRAASPTSTTAALIASTKSSSSSTSSSTTIKILVPPPTARKQNTLRKTIRTQTVLSSTSSSSSS